MKMFIFVIVVAGLSTIAESTDPTEAAPTTPPKPTNKIEVCTGKADVILLLDRSGSVGDHDFPFLLDFAIHLARTFNISKDKVRLGLASYADHGTRDIELNTFGFTNFQNQINQMSRGTEEYTNVHDGLLKAEKMLEDASNGARNDPDTVKLIVVTNDGPANRGIPPLPTADRIKKKGINIVSIGIEEDVAPPDKHQETQGLASRPDLYYFVPHYTGLADQGFLQKVTKAVCRIVTVTPVDANNVNESIYENTPIDTNIHKIPVFNGDENNKPQYHILNSDPALPFRVDINGNIIVTGMLDRETKDVYVFRVRITDINIPNYSEVVRVTIHILDVNDNDPIPINNEVEYTIELYENEQFNPPKTVFTVSATDIDIGLNGAIMYVLTGGNGDNRFQLLPVSGELQLHNELDRETKDFYKLTAVAKDKGNPSRSSVDITINVIVKDVNDNPPTPSEAVVYLEYPEDQPKGNLHQLIAADLDIGVNGQFIFVFADSSGNEDGKFGLNTNTGYISLVNSLNYENKKSYTLHIIVEDKGSPKLSSPITVHVTVTNIDDPPTIIAPLHKDIPENFGTTDVVLTVSVDDPENEAITFQIVETSPFSIDGNGNIKVLGVIDREAPVYQYVLTIKATVGGHTVSTTASINILDVNDEYPTFSKNQYSGSIFEHSIKSTPVAGDLVSVSDNDATSPNNKFTFAITAGNTNDAFQIDPNSGVLTVYNPDVLDYESAIHQFTLTLMVTDKGTPSLSTTATYVINIRDINDNPPVFKTNDATVNLVFPESQALGNLYKFIAEDLDTGVNGIVTYTIESSDGNGKFSLDLNSGYLTLVSSFDFEEKNSYELIVKAEDGGSPSLHAFVTVYIKVTNIDEILTINGPFSERIPENFAKQKTIVTVTATDPENGAITYSILETSPFEIDGNGQLTLVGDIDRESDIYEYILTIRATAGAHTVQTTVTIIVDDVNDNYPTFSETGYSGSVSETAVKDAPVTLNKAISADDKDATSPNNEFMFRIFSGNTDGAFQINSKNGALSIANPDAIDFESSIKEYTLTIEVFDKGTPSLYSTATVIITVIDENDNTPIFTDGTILYLQFPENRQLGRLYEIVATDLDSGLNGMIVYTITSGDQQKFALDAQNHLILKTSFDFEVKQLFQLVIKAEDKGSPSKSSSITVHISVTDVDEPLKINGPFSERILENFAKQVTIVTVTATDPENGAITYSIMETSPFAIDGNGQVRLVGDIDRESATYEYTLTIKATAGAHTVQTTVTIIVDDVNDNVPTFTENTYTGNIDENAAKGTEVTTSTPVGASDGDATSPNNKFTFMIVSGNTNDAFTINPENGKVSVNKPSQLDYESNVKSFTLTIKVSDQGDPILSSTTTYHITINNLNDNAPTFTLPSNEGSVFENSDDGTNVVNVEASDVDGDTLTYSIPAGLPFSISSTGQIYISGLVDAESIEIYTFIVTVSDGVHTASATVKITVLDINDVVPTFTVPGPLTRNVQEIRAVGYVIANLVGQDGDLTSPNNVFMMMIDSGNADGKFVLENGELKIAEKLIFNDKKSYKVIVKIEDKGTNPGSLSSTIEININVEDSNIHAPHFIGSPYTADVAENIDEPFVFKVSATDADLPNDELKFSIENSVPFTIDPNTGDIKGTQTFDSEGTYMYVINVKVTDKASHSDQTTVTVTILDENDNTPYFTAGLTKLTQISESLVIGTVLETYSAKDNDRTSPNNVVKFQIISGNTGDAFELGTSNGELKVKSTLDFETQSSYTLTIRAFDGGDPMKYVDQIVEIMLKNENEHTPVFQPEEYVKEVKESEDHGFQVLTAVATDADSDSVITYSIPNNIPFDIDNNGEITLKSLNPPEKPLNYENVKQYIFDVTVADEGGLTDTAKVTINVLDVNDNDPTFSDGPYIEYVPEDKPTQSVIVKIEASDADSTTNGMLMYEIVEQQTVFSLNVNNELVLEEPLDFESNNKIYILHVRATDKGTPSRSTEVKVTIHVTDVNEKPEFPEVKDSIHIPENSAVNLPIGLVEAKDPDDGNNGNIMYTIISGNEDGVFDVNMNNGIVTQKLDVNHEAKEKYVLIIRATDKGNPPLDTSGKDLDLTIYIDDVNEKPYFDPTSTTKTISETISTGETVITVSANDPDDGTAGMVMYEIISGNDNGDFEISDPNTGTVTVKNELSVNRQDKYVLKIRATDKGTNPLHTGPDDFMVTIMLTDDNNNAPIFDPVKYSQNVSESSATDVFVIQVFATDDDEGSNGEILYSIIGGNTDDTFSINEITGKINLVKAVDHETISMYTLIVRATDKGTPISRHSDPDAMVKIFISNENEHAPEITNLPESVLIPENESGLSIFTVTAEDKDGDVIKYSIVTDGPFIIDTSSGEITNTAELNREGKDTYKIKVTASDGTLQDMKILTVTVTDKNDLPPIFENSFYEKTIPETEQEGNVIITVTANDGDLGDNAKVMYMIVGGNAENKFKLDPTFGSVSVNGQLDFDTQHKYNLTIRASDKGVPTNHAYVTLIIHITEVQDPPHFTNGPFNFCIDENLPTGTPVFTASAEDENDDTLTFSISPTVNIPFQIDASTGEVTTTIPIDAEKFTRFNFTITVSDHKASVSILASVCINDLNDNYPSVITPNDAVICENADVNSNVWKIEATDIDSVSKILTYTILSSDPELPFKIDQTGQITNVGDLDHERQSEYNFKVKVSDGEKYTEVDVKVTICDLNEHSPIFAPVIYNVKIPDGSESSTFVVNVTATDADPGINGEIVYSIIAGNVDGDFTIDPNTGRIEVVNKVDASRTETYTLTVRATDKGDPARISNPDATVTITVMKMNVTVCECVLPQTSYPCIKWTKYEIIRKFDGKCYLDKLKAAIVHITAKIELVKNLIKQFNACKGELRHEINSKSSGLSYTDLFKRYDNCVVNSQCKLSIWQIQLEQKKMQLEKEKVIEEEGWGTFNIPGSDYMKAFYDIMKKSQSSRW